MIAPDVDAGDGSESWAQRAAGASPVLALPLDFPRLAARGRIGVQPCALAAEIELASFAASEAVDDEAVVFAAFVAVLRRYTSEERILTAIDCGDELALARIDVRADAEFRALAHSVDREFALTLRSSRALRTALPDPAAHIGFRVGDRDAAPVGPAETPFDLTLECARRSESGELHCAIEYRADLFAPDTIARLAGHLGVLLAAALRTPWCAIGELPLLTEIEAELQRACNATHVPCRRNATVVDLLREQAARTPAAIALECGGEALTYAQLDAQANQLGAYLRTRGVGPEVIVAVCIERSIDMVVAVLGVQRAGGAYLPIDPTYPRDRIAFMVSDAHAALAVTEDASRDRLPATLPAVSLDGEGAAIRAVDPTLPLPAIDPMQLAYVIYTSGTTGRPKGVQIEHRNLFNFVNAMQAVVGAGPGDALVAVYSIAFDPWGEEMYVSLAHGARVVIASRETIVNPKALAALYERVAPTIAVAPPSMWRMMIEAGWRGSRNLRLRCGGEALPPALAEALLDRVGEVWNVYGPTEATVVSTIEPIVRGRGVTIGRPLANVTAYVLDDGLQALPTGIAGELYIGGESVGRGYLNRPELTAERFLSDPFRGTAGTRMYRTGDRARFRSDGSIEFLGRADFQAKLRGYRIELGEVEANLERRPGVRSAVAIVREDVPGDQRLVAYVTVESRAAFCAAATRRDLERDLPSFMIPDFVIVLDTLPLSSNGKVDRQRLPRPSGNREDSGATILAPRSALEAQLLAIWQDVLDIRPIGVLDDFFELGASSFVAARLFDRIERELGTRLPLAPLFQAPTIEKLAQLIESRAMERRFTSLVAIQPVGTKPPIFCVHGGAGTVLHLQALAARLGKNQPFYGFQVQGLYGDACPQLTAQEMAAHYIAELTVVQPAGPYVIAGYCFGALIAFEMACELERRGQKVALLVNFNGPSTTYLKRFGLYFLPPALRAGAAEGPRSRLPRMLAFAGRARMRRNLGRLRTAWSRRLLAVATRICVALRRPLPDAWREPAIFELCHIVERRYRPGRFAGSMLLFTGADLFPWPDLGWTPFVAKGVRICEVPGDHQSTRDIVREPYLAVVSERLLEELERAFSVALPAP